MNEKVVAKAPDQFEEMWLKAMPLPAAYLHQTANWPGVMSLEKSLVKERIGADIEIRVFFQGAVVLFKKFNPKTKRTHRMATPFTNFANVILEDA